MRLMSKCERFIYGPRKIKVISPEMVRDEKITRLSKLIRREELKQLPILKRMDAMIRSKEIGFMVEGVPRHAAYQSTKPDIMVKALSDTVNLRRVVILPDKINFCDWGAGMGSSGLAAHEYLKYLVKIGIISDFHVTGFELNDKFNAITEKIAGKMEMKQVSIINRDFTTLTRDELKPFNLIYIWRPFLEDFGPVMNKVLPRIRSGSYIMARDCWEANVLEDTSLFTKIFHPVYYIYGTKISLYRRTEKEAPQEGK